MARESLHAQVGNPNNTAALPRSKPGLQFPSHVFSAGEDIRHTVKTLAIAAGFAGVAFSTLLMITATTLHEEQALLLVLCLMFAVGSPRLRPFAAGCILTATVAIVFSMMRPTEVQTSTVSLAALALMGILFPLHYAAHCRSGWASFDVHPRRRSLLRTPPAISYSLLSRI